MTDSARATDQKVAGSNPAERAPAQRPCRVIDGAFYVGGDAHGRRQPSLARVVYASAGTAPPSPSSRSSLALPSARSAFPLRSNADRCAPKARLRRAGRSARPRPGVRSFGRSRPSDPPPGSPRPSLTVTTLRFPRRDRLRAAPGWLGRASKSGGPPGHKRGQDQLPESPSELTAPRSLAQSLYGRPRADPPVPLDVSATRSTTVNVSSRMTSWWARTQRARGSS